MYGLEFVFLQQLKESPYLTTDPNEADYFYYVAYLYYGTHDMTGMIAAMRSFGPYFDRKNASDHLFVITDDFGGCAYQFQLPPKAIAIHHFGRVYDAFEPNPCKWQEYFASHCDYHIKLAEMPEQRPPCHRPFVHIVVPPAHLFERHDLTPGTDFARDPAYYRNWANRTTRFFYAGPINLHKDDPHALTHPESDAQYSWGVRQTVFRLYKNLPGWKFFEKHVPDYAAQQHNAQFCLAALGWGWGGRMKAAVLNGCIPVVIQPQVKVEWEEQLPLHDYALRLPFYMIHKLPEVLQRIVSTGRGEQMQRAMACAWRFHHWEYPTGRAFDLVMCELKARLLKARPRLNTTTCTLDCGDGHLIAVHGSSPYMV